MYLLSKVFVIMATGKVHLLISIRSNLALTKNFKPLKLGVDMVINIVLSKVCKIMY